MILEDAQNNDQIVGGGQEIEDEDDEGHMEGEIHEEDEEGAEYLDDVNYGNQQYGEEEDESEQDDEEAIMQ